MLGRLLLEAGQDEIRAHLLEKTEVPDRLPQGAAQDPIPAERPSSRQTAAP
jgi:hypothetical protein